MKGVPNELRVEELGQGSSAPEPPAQCACSRPQLQLRFSPWADGHFPWLSLDTCMYLAHERAQHSLEVMEHGTFCSQQFQGSTVKSTKGQGSVICPPLPRGAQVDGAGDLERKSYRSWDGSWGGHAGREDTQISSREGSLWRSRVPSMLSPLLPCFETRCG